METLDDIKELFKETSKQISDLRLETKSLRNLFESQWGKLMETLVEGDLINILNERGINVYDTSKRRKGCRNGVNYEFDIIAHNGVEVVIVEVKTTLRIEDVKEFEEKMKSVKTLLPDMAHNKIYPAMAFLQADGGSETMAEKRGMFVIKATGNSASIVNKIDFSPKVF